MYNIERMKKIGESILYKICKSTKEIEGKIYTVFGIECEKIRIDDVSSDRIRVMRLVELANADRKSTRLNSSHKVQSRMPSSA